MPPCDFSHKAPRRQNVTVDWRIFAFDTSRHIMRDMLYVIIYLPAFAGNTRRPPQCDGAAMSFAAAADAVDAAAAISLYAIAFFFAAARY